MIFISNLPQKYIILPNKKYMKKILFSILFLILLCCSLLSNAQVVPQDDEKSGAGFVSLNMNVTSIDGNIGVYSGGGGGFIVKDFRLGVFFSGLASKISVKAKDSENKYQLSNSYGGLWVGYPLWKTKPFHALVDLKICVGNTNTVNANNRNRSNSAIFYGLMPSVGVEYYFTETFAIAMGVDYKYCMFPVKPEIPDISVYNMSGLYLSLKLGIF